MTEHSKNNNEYTAQDFERYYSGKMSSPEMHQLEKAAMEDPFLADALEGYQYTASPIDDQKYLATQLQLKTQEGKVVPLKRTNTSQFLRIAALFILLAGCGWAVYQFGFNKTNNDIASAEETKIVAPSSSPVGDSNSKEADLNYSTANADSNKQVTTINNDDKGSVSLSTQNRHTGKLNNSNLSKRTETSEKSGNVGNAEISQDDRMVSSTSDARLQNLPDTSTDRVTYNYQTVTPGKDNVIVMRQSKAAPIPEVVLATKKKDSTYRQPHISFEEAEPAEGNVNYDDYVANNLQMPEEIMKKNISGEVKLSFDINNAGQAINIEVEKSLCAECDKEAIRLLKEGPKLVQKKKDKKGKIRIQF